MKPDEFWNYSIGEIYDLIESYRRNINLENEKEEAKLKIEIILNSTLARQIGESIGCLFDKNAKITPLNKLYPNLFDTDEETESKADLELYKAKMDDYMFRHNSRMKGGEN